MAALVPNKVEGTFVRVSLLITDSKTSLLQQALDLTTLRLSKAEKQLSDAHVSVLV